MPRKIPKQNMKNWDKNLHFRVIIVTYLKNAYNSITDKTLTCLIHEELQRIKRIKSINCKKNRHNILSLRNTILKVSFKHMKRCSSSS